jgi:transcriptional regulator with XRE-family HTH domain
MLASHHIRKLTLEHSVSTTSIDQTTAFEENAATFGGRLQAARMAKGLTQAGLGEKLGVDLSAIAAWENDDREPRANRIQMLAGMLNVSIIWLITGESNGTDNVEQTHDRPAGINDALGEISQLKETLAGALEKLENLEQRLRAVE